MPHHLLPDLLEFHGTSPVVPECLRDVRATGVFTWTWEEQFSGLYDSTGILRSDAASIIFRAVLHRLDVEPSSTITLAHAAQLTTALPDLFAVMQRKFRGRHGSIAYRHLQQQLGPLAFAYVLVECPERLSARTLIHQVGRFVRFDRARLAGLPRPLRSLMRGEARISHPDVIRLHVAVLESGLGVRKGFLARLPEACLAEFTPSNGNQRSK